MDYRKALRILDLGPESGQTEIKKRYRLLMQTVHPDVQSFLRVSEGEVKDYKYEIHEINAAYDYLCKIKYEGVASGGAQADAGKGKSNGSSQEAGGRGGYGGKPTSPWTAPVNETAYTDREIYEYMEDAYGNHCGTYTVARGKYIWSFDEDFKLFLLSIYNCSKQLLAKVKPEIAAKYQGELAYLLAQQYVYPEEILTRLAKDISEDDGAKVFYIPSMLETEKRRISLEAGATLYPSGVRNHRLYLMGRNRNEVGYISFVDDRLYYAVVPMFEQRRVQVKVKLVGTTSGNNNVRRVEVPSLDLWIRMGDRDMKGIMVSINDRIEGILESC